MGDITTEASAGRLSVSRLDIEKRIGFPAGRFTQAGPVLPLVSGAVISLAFYATLIPLKGTWFAESFIERGWVPYATVTFSGWALMIVLIKAHKVSVQSKAISRTLVPSDPEFVLSTMTVDRVLDRLYEVADEPRQFILFNRIHTALANLRNMGQIADVEGVMRAQADNDEAAMESSYTVARGLIWAIPVLGFIGTVLGLSQAISAFTKVLNQSTELDAIKGALQSVTSGLATAFETTLQALVAALVIQMLLTMTKRREEQMLDACTEYCQQHIIGRLRLRADSTLREGPHAPSV